MGGITLPGFQGVMDVLNSLLSSDMVSNYLFWVLGISLVGLVLGTLIAAFRK